MFKGRGLKERLTAKKKDMFLWKEHSGPPAQAYVCVCVYAQSLNHVRLFVTPWTVAHQTPLSMEFFQQEFWSRLPCPPLGDLSNLGIEPTSPALQAGSLPSELPGKPSMGMLLLLLLLLSCFSRVRLCLTP